MLLDVSALTVTFQTRAGPLQAVSEVSFELKEGEILGVVGESGSGKTLSQLAVMGLIDHPDAKVGGSIKLNGKELLGQSAEQWRRLRGNTVAMIFQDPMTALTPVHTIGAQIVEQIQAHRDMSTRAALARTIELLGEMGMPNPRAQAERYPHQLSGGMRQRAVIAMALSCDPALLIADEPTTALDVTVQAQILHLLRRLRADFGSSIILITHDMGVVAEIADRVLVMYAGRVAEQAAAASLFSRPAHPYTIGLLGSIPALHGPRAMRLPAIPGAPPLLADISQGCAFQPRCPHRHERCVLQPPLFGTAAPEAGQAACWLVEERTDWPPARAAAVRA